MFYFPCVLFSSSVKSLQFIVTGIIVNVKGKSFGIKMNNTEEDERIETSLDMDWVASLEMKVSDTEFRDRSREPTIFRVPNILKKVDIEAYEPLLVSLGPYHRGQPHLQAMNQLKWKYLKSVLKQNSGMVMKDYVGLIKKLETRARDAYSEEVEMSSNNFVEMMLLDGCFVILTIMEYSITMKISEESTSWTRNVVLRDIFLLENQLPFFLLETLYESAFPQGAPFRELTFQLIRKYFSSNSSIMELPSDNETFHHIIHLCLSCIDSTINHGNYNQSSSTFGFLCNSKLVKTVFVLWPSKLRSSLLSQVNKIRTVRDANPEEDLNGNGNQSSNTFGFLCNSKLVKTVFVSLPSKLSSSLLSRDANPKEDLPGSRLLWMPSATLCNEAGIHYKRKQKAKNFLDITFHNGKLEIPQIRIDDSTNMFLRNLIAYEQCSMNSKFHVTSYVALMDHLVDTAEDVELLQRHEIIINDLGESQEIAALFNKLCTNIIYSYDFYLADVLTAMRKHHDTRCNKWRARLNRDYFSNPWAAISLFGALALFVLTVIQTTFTILSYFRSSN